MAVLSRPTRRRVFYGWWLVLVLGCLNLMSSGIFYYGFSTFFLPLTKEFGWSYALTSSAYSITQIEGMILGPLVGYAFDRLGPRKLVVAGALLHGIGYLAFSRADSYLTFTLATILMAAGHNIGLGSVGMATVANWFVRKRTVALGLLMAGAGVGGLLVPVISLVIESQGWRTAAVANGLAVWAVALPLSLLLRHRPEDMGLLPDGDKPGSSPEREGVRPGPLPAGAADVIEAEIGVKQALRTRFFWLLAAAGMLAFVSQSALNVHLIPRLNSIGIPPTLAAASLSVLLMISIVGRIGFGWLGDRMQKRHVLAMTLALQVGALVVFATLSQPWMLFLFLVVYAPGYGGGIPLRSAMLAEYFGRRSFGAIQGIFFGLTGLGGVAGPVLAGWMFDVLGSYDLAFWLLAAVMATTLPIVFALPRSSAVGRRSLPRV